LLGLNNQRVILADLINLIYTSKIYKIHLAGSSGKATFLLEKK
jgi:hypothetical protein